MQNVMHAQHEITFPQYIRIICSIVSTKLKYFKGRRRGDAR